MKLNKKVFIAIATLVFLIIIFVIFTNKTINKNITQKVNTIQSAVVLVKPQQSKDSSLIKDSKKINYAKPIIKLDTNKANISVNSITDTIAPYNFANPSGGLFYDSIKVEITSSEECTVYYQTPNTFGFVIYTEMISIGKNTNLSFYSIDKAGNRSVDKIEKYYINSANKNKCPQNMVYVDSSSIKGFCIDVYEWPNIKGATPLSLVSLYGAKDSCLTQGKRICTSQEWYLACSGISNTKHSYGENYEEKSCNTSSGILNKSGTNPECRSYFGAMDMNGNLREWTDTKATEDKRFYRVHGGYYESNMNSKCKEYQYSFYPENTHYSVGFRCCKDSKN